MRKTQNRVIFQAHREDELVSIDAYLMPALDGTAWAFPTEASRIDLPTLATAYRLKPEQLERERDTEDGASQYRYREILEIPLHELQRPPKVTGRFL
jgi:hypothetical protein